MVKGPRREKELTWELSLCCRDNLTLVLRYSRYWILDVLKVLQVLDTGGTPSTSGTGYKTYSRYSRFCVQDIRSPGNFLFVVKISRVAPTADSL